MAKSQSRYLISEAIHFGWNRTKQRFGFFVALLLATTIISRIPAVIGAQLPENSPPALLLFLIFAVLNVIISWGIIKISLLEARGVNASWSSFLGTARDYWQFFLVSLVYTLIVLAGFILLIIPGIIWSIKYQYMIYLVIDKNMGIRESMKLSAAMTDGVKWDLLAFEFITGIINVLGFFALIIGLLMTVPTSIIAQAKVYDRLLERVKA